MDAYRQFVQRYKDVLDTRLPVPKKALPKVSTIASKAPVVLLFSPHPDDEVITGALALRLQREVGARVINMAVTLGSNSARREERREELENACALLGWESEVLGWKNVTPDAAKRDPAVWHGFINSIAQIIQRWQPKWIFYPHAEDWHPTHRGVHKLVEAALTKAEQKSPALRVQTEYWQPHASPNLLIECAPDSLALLVAALCDVLPAGGEPGLRRLRHVRHDLRADTWRTGQGHRDAGDQGISRRRREPRSRLLIGAIRRADGRHHRPDGDPVPLHGPADGRMNSNRPDWLAHTILGLGVLLFALPVWLVLAGSTQDSGAITRGDLSLLPRFDFSAYPRVLTHGTMGTQPVWHMLLVSGGMALAIACGKIVISILSAYAVVFFRFPFRRTAFWLIFITLMLPPEVQIIPTYTVMSAFGLINSFTGLTVPLIASATATLLFRQVFVAIPDELVEAARMDGAGPLRFLRDILVPVSSANIAALFVILFVYGWNQYLWPLLVATSPGLDTIVIGIVKMIGVETQTDWSAVMATAVLALLPPIVVVVLMQRWFVAGLTEGEK